MAVGKTHKAAQCKGLSDFDVVSWRRLVRLTLRPTSPVETDHGVD
jgi:hypothetical protein